MSMKKPTRKQMKCIIKIGLDLKVHEQKATTLITY